MKYLVVIVSLLFVACSSPKKVVELKSESYTNPTIIVEEPIKEVSYTPLTPTELYVKKYAPIAIEEMRKFKIPASVTLAQGILESGNGNSNLAQRSNNHFGIKCHSGWKGERVYHDDDAKGECFRKYKYVASSYQDHSLFLVTRFRYASLFNLDKDDYKGWAKGLKKAGYATDPNYPNKLISYIEKYKLYEYDEVVLKGRKIESYEDELGTEPIVIKPKEEVVKIEPLVEVKKPVSTNSNTIGLIHVVKEEDTLYSISKQYGVSIEEIKTLNDLEENNINIGDSLRMSGTVVKSGYHVVKPKETLYSISKQYNVTVEELKSLNGLHENHLDIGQQLRVK